MEYHKTLINQVNGRFTINFAGSFPNNKFALSKGQKIYLTEPEWDFVQANLQHIIGNQVIVEGEKATAPKPANWTKDLATVDPEEFFALHHAKAKAKIKDLNAKDLDKLIDHANAEEINSKLVDALIEKANEAGD